MEFEISILLNIYSTLYHFVVPAVMKVVYSTCSVHVTENEGVVSSALRSAEATEFVLAKQDDVLPSWPRRGLQSSLNLNGEEVDFVKS